MNLSFEIVAGAIGASFLVSLTSLSGMFALWIEAERLKRIIPYLVALAVGVLLGDAFIHLIPDAVNRQGSISMVCFATLGGVFVFFILEKMVRWRHDHYLDGLDQAEYIKPIAKMNLMGDAVHNFVDGILIAGSFLVDSVLGFTTTLAIIAHEIPQEIGDVGALVYGGYSPVKAVLYNFYCSLTVVAGAVFTLLFSQAAESSLVFLLPVAAGGFIYIAATDMIPALHEHSTLTHLFGQTAIFAFGIGFMQSIIILERFLFNQ
ncbi:ZIP family metal transporter [Candidatus Methylobacter oryzae]|uniref:ZIP family metal transporter n=1 Tax=Candidatus Methylobacter oryzae TaxID=2497749 RepID=A0ABY3CCY8_9GAMM|nr:ZIP family metal transporter [Candidatus Methylobacter oryzae]TRW98954.1 ZIP family metal transporter [Candidatus Methylobacter oryzae]